MNTKSFLILDIFAILFVVWLFAWNIGKINVKVTTQPYASERWGNASFSDFLTLKAGKRFFEEGIATHYWTSNMTVGFKEFSRGWYSYQARLDALHRDGLVDSATHHDCHAVL